MLEPVRNGISHPQSFQQEIIFFSLNDAIGVKPAYDGFRS
jgi:hypothetical protein